MSHPDGGTLPSPDPVAVMVKDFESHRAGLHEQLHVLEEENIRINKQFGAERQSLHYRIDMLDRALNDQKTMTPEDREQIHYGSMGNG
jgi:hypothetical protein